jgi:hypothetical protein
MEQLCGHVDFPATREYAVIEETFSVNFASVLYIGD